MLVETLLLKRGFFMQKTSFYIIIPALSLGRIKLFIFDINIWVEYDDIVSRRFATVVSFKYAEIIEVQEWAKVHISESSSGLAC